MPKRVRQQEEEAHPVATRPKAQQQPRPYWTNESSRSDESGQHTAPFNVFPNVTDAHLTHSSHTDDSDNKSKVVLRSNSEIRREHSDPHRRSDLTAWKTLSLPPPDTTNQSSAVHIPEWARQPSQDLALPSSSSHIQPPQDNPSSISPTPPSAPLYNHHLCLSFFDRMETRSSMCMERHRKMRKSGTWK